MMTNDNVGIQVDVTTDIYLVAAYLTLGAELELPVDNTDPRHYKFRVKGENLSEIKAQWLKRGEVAGNLADYARIIRDIKLLIHN